ncbi:GNAT family N-acetyltransferase, partial [candidate division WOR-3 bacterium]|nr:GNAT family N-acetyltransferase [candidate division WOR-3 bacterium]
MIRGMEIEAFRDWTEIIPEWERLQREHSAPTPFLSYQWLSTWWKHFGNPKELLTLLIKDKEENLIGIVPLSIKEGKTELLGDQSLCDYQDILFQKGSEKPCLSLLLDYLSKSSKLPLYIHSLPGFSPLFQLQREENQCRISEAGTTPIIYLPSSYDEYLLSLGPKQRHEIRRKIIRIEKEGEIDFYSTGAHQSLGQFLKLHKSSKEKAEFMTPKIEQFFYEVATLFSKQGWLKLFFLTFNKKEIASLLCFQLDRTLYLYNSGY